MSKKSQLFELLAVIAVTALLAGCGGNSENYSKYVTLADYKNLSAELVVEEVTKEALDEYENEQLDEYVTYEETTGSVKEGQMVQVSLLAKEGDEVIYDFSEDGYELIIGKQDFGAEVDEALLGRSSGDILDFSVSYDDEFADMMLAGKEIGYHIEILEISDVSYPELTDAFVEENFGEKSVDAWRETLAEELRSEYETTARDDLREGLVQQVIDGSQFHGYPKDLYKQNEEMIQADYESYAEMFGCSVDEIYEMFDVDEEQRKQECLDQTNRTMVLALIREQENMTLSEEQMQEKMEAFAQENGYDSVEEYLSEYDEKSIRQYFLDEMTIDFIVEHANIVD